MLKLSYIILLLSSAALFSQTPHSKSVDNYDCSDCHSTENWEIIKSEMSFNHSATNFELMGQHINADCRQCHTTLNFTKVNQNCADCHLDIHENTLGKECESCHNPDSWLVSDIIAIHEQSRFPLIGNHRTADCNQCHISSSNLRFEPLGLQCIDCHRENYLSTQNPNHKTAGFSTECQDCHDLSAFEWSLSSFAHDFFPLSGGHNISNCFDCHSSGNFTGLSSACFSCHESDYTGTNNPNHISLSLATTCETCHTTNPGWEPASFNIHDSFYRLIGAHANISNNCFECHNGNYNSTPNDCIGCHLNDYNSTTNPNHSSANFSTDCETCHSQSAWIPSSFDHDAQYFPIFSGEHRNEWNDCSDCHVNQSNFQLFECINCHEHNQTEMDDKHQGIGGYIYQSQACYSCHPDGTTLGAFNHSLTNFTLTGAHLQVNCIDCHQSGYAGTSTLCYDCHGNNYNSTTNPNHQNISLATTCEDCHTTQPGWKPAQFSVHTNFYPLVGAHSAISNDCATCHNGNYNNTPNNCVGCHLNDYNNTTNPSHQNLSLATTCEDCHTSQPGWNPAQFPVHSNFYPLLGAHATISNDCITCHNGNYNNTPNNCAGCHLDDYNNTTNPNHSSANFTTDCETCHTQNAWIPSTFDHDTQYFPIYSGTHNEEWNACSDCHVNPSNYQLFECIDCHEHNQNDMDDKHQGISGYLYQSQACFDCHPDGTAMGAFNHTLTNFELTGAHIGLQCVSCHQTGYSGTSTLCYDCHSNNYNNTTNPNHQNLSLATACGDCHTTQPGWKPAQFPMHTNFYPLIGAHANISNDCTTCHNGNYNNTPNQCYGCHENDFNNTTNPDHQNLSLATTCEDCHTSQPGWSPAQFPIHSNYFQLIGAHAAISNDCATCHNGNYNNTPNQCYGCHENDYITSTNPPHASAGFPTDCETCHTTFAWIPSTFDHDGQYFPIYSGTHHDEWDNCSDCHTNSSNYSVFECIFCHEHYQQSMNEHHSGVPNYIYLSTACYDCHPTGNSIPIINTHNQKNLQ